MYSSPLIVQHEKHKYRISYLRAEHQRNSNAVFLFQVAGIRHAFCVAHPAIFRSAAFHVVRRHGTLGFVRPVVQRRAEFNAVVETVHISFHKLRSFHVSVAVQGRCDVAVSGEGQAGCLSSFRVARAVRLRECVKGVVCIWAGVERRVCWYCGLVAG